MAGEYCPAERAYWTRPCPPRRLPIAARHLLAAIGDSQTEAWNIAVKDGAAHAGN